MTDSVRRKGPDPVEVYFLTDPLCPWSWAMEPLAESLRRDKSLAFRSVLAGWLPSLQARGVDAVKAEWADAAAKTGARIDPTYWDRVAPTTSLVAAAAVKAAEFQGAAKGEAYLSAVRHAAFARGEDVTSFEVLAGVAEAVGLRADLFRVDLGVGRYAVGDVVAALAPDQSASESVRWFGRRKMLRSWEALAEDLGNAERRGLRPPAFHILRGKKETLVRGFASEPQVRDAIRSAR